MYLIVQRLKVCVCVCLSWQWIGFFELATLQTMQVHSSVTDSWHNRYLHVWQSSQFFMVNKMQMYKQQNLHPSWGQICQLILLCLIKWSYGWLKTTLLCFKPAISMYGSYRHNKPSAVISQGRKAKNPYILIWHHLVHGICRRVCSCHVVKARSEAKQIIWLHALISVKFQLNAVSNSCLSQPPKDFTLFFNFCLKWHTQI